MGLSSEPTGADNRGETSGLFWGPCRGGLAVSRAAVTPEDEPTPAGLRAMAKARPLSPRSSRCTATTLLPAAPRRAPPHPPHARDAERVLEASALHGGVHLFSRAGTDTALGCHLHSSCRRSPPRPPLGHSLPVIWTLLPPSKKASGSLALAGRAPGLGVGTVEMERSLRESYCEICAAQARGAP